MLLYGSSLLQQPVMSLQTGTELARIRDVVIDPRTLNVVGFQLEGRLLENQTMVLMPRDIRELGSVGFIIDSSDEFVDPQDIISLQTVVDFEFTLSGIKVVDQKKHTLGKVFDFTLNPVSYQIEQLRIKRPLLKSLNDSELLVGRSNIVEVQNTIIIVKSETKRTPTPILQSKRSYTNPFRQVTSGPATQSESIAD